MGLSQDRKIRKNRIRLVKWKAIESISGYHRLPDHSIEWDRWNMTNGQIEEYWRIERIRQKFYNITEGYRMGNRRCRIYSERYQKILMKKVDNDATKFYYDCSGTCINSPGFHFSSFYTSFGIKQIDSAFVEQIMALGTDQCYFTEEELEECILRQPNLHPMIRMNLYSNLKSRATL